MSEYARLYKEIEQIEEILKTIVELNEQNNTAKTDINKLLSTDNEVIKQINIINYLYNALT